MPNCEGLKKEFAGIFGIGVETAEQDEIMCLARAAAQKGCAPTIRVACGAQDFLLELNHRFAKEMAGFPLSFRYDEWAGEHDWIFWNEALRRVLGEFGC